MARIPYADVTGPEARPLAERIVAERGHVPQYWERAA